MRKLWFLFLFLGLGFVGALWLMLHIVSSPGQPAIELATGKTRPQGGIVVLCTTEPKDLNPFTTTDAVAQRMVLRYTHETLMEWDPATGSLRAAAAVNTRPGPAPDTMLFKIRPGLRFSDGSLVTSADLTFPQEVVATGIVTLGTAARALRRVRHAAMAGPDTLAITLDTPGSPGLWRKIATSYPIVKRQHFIGESGRIALRTTDGVLKPTPPLSVALGHLHHVQLPGPGTGPYKVSAPLWRKGMELWVVQNKHSWRHSEQRDHWNLAAFRLRFVQDQAARFALLRQRQIDLFTDPDVRGLAGKHPDLKQDYRPLVYDQAWSGNYVVLWNHRRPHLGDPRVRRALTMLFDRQAIVEKLMAGQGKITSTWFRPGSQQAGEAPSPLPFDPRQARSLLAEAGITDDKPLKLQVQIAAGQPLHRRILELAQPAFATTPVRLQVQEMNSTTMFRNLGQHNYQGMLVFIGLGPDPDPLRHFRKPTTTTPSLTGYDNDEVFDVLRRAESTADAAEVLQLYHRFNDMFHQDQPVTLLAYPLTGALLHRRFQEAEPNHLGLYPERWWVKPEDRR